MSYKKIDAYQTHTKTTETVQETEAAVLEKAAFCLENAQPIGRASCRERV